MQLNIAVFCASSACGVSVEHMNAKKSMIRSIYRFHVYYHIRRILKILEIPLLFENSFKQYNNSYNHEMFIKICGEYGVSNDLMNWRNQKYFATWQSRAWETVKPGMSYINENSFSRRIIEKSDGLNMIGLQKLSEAVRDCVYLILMSQTSTRGPIVGHEALNLDAQRVFLNTFENIISRRVNIPEDIQRFQKTLQYTRCNASVNSKHQHPPGDPWGFKLYCCPGGRDLYLMTFPGGQILHIHKITFSTVKKYTFTQLAFGSYLHVLHRQFRLSILA